jgi:hypothetical protein
MFQLCSAEQTVEKSEAHLDDVAMLLPFELALHELLLAQHLTFKRALDLIWQLQGQRCCLHCRPAHVVTGVKDEVKHGAVRPQVRKV